MPRKKPTPQTITRPRAGLYLRTAPDDGPPLEGQRQQTQAMALVKGCEVVGVYEDLGVPGTMGLARRPALRRLYEDVQRQAVAVVIVASLDRLGTSSSLVLRLIEDITAQGAYLLLCQEQWDTTTPTGQFVQQMFGALLELERAATVARTTAGRNARGLVDGERGGNLPYGYRRDAERGVVADPQTAPVVRRIFTLRRARATLAMIAPLQCP